MPVIHHQRANKLATIHARVLSRCCDAHTAAGARHCHMGALPLPTQEPACCTWPHLLPNPRHPVQGRPCSTVYTLQLSALCNCLHFAIVCPVQLSTLCNCLPCATVYTVQGRPCTTVYTVQLSALCNCLHCAIVCPVQLSTLCNCLPCATVYTVQGRPCATVYTVQLSALCNCAPDSLYTVLGWHGCRAGGMKG